MNIILKRPAGMNIVLRPQALPRWRPASNTHAATVELHFYRKSEGPLKRRQIGIFKPGDKVSITYDPRADDPPILITRSRSVRGKPNTAYVEDGPTVEVLYSRPNASPAADSIDAHVPTIGAAPTVTLDDNRPSWHVYCPRPSDYGYSHLNLNIQVRRDDDLTVIVDRQLGDVTHAEVSQYAFDCRARYRWQNQSTEDAGNGRGWSAWSADALAYGSAPGATNQNPPETGQPPVANDPNDVRNPSNRKVLYQ